MKWVMTRVMGTGYDTTCDRSAAGAAGRAPGPRVRGRAQPSNGHHIVGGYESSPGLSYNTTGLALEWRRGHV